MTLPPTPLSLPSPVPQWLTLWYCSFTPLPPLPPPPPHPTHTHTHDLPRVSAHTRKHAGEVDVGPHLAVLLRQHPPTPPPLLHHLLSPSDLLCSTALSPPPHTHTHTWTWLTYLGYQPTRGACRRSGCWATSCCTAPSTPPHPHPSSIISLLCSTAPSPPPHPPPPTHMNMTYLPGVSAHPGCMQEKWMLGHILLYCSVMTTCCLLVWA